MQTASPSAASLRSSTPISVPSRQTTLPLTMTKGTASITVDNNGTSADTVVYANSKTVFVVKTGTDTYKAYTGIANVPSVGGTVTVAYYCKSSSMAIQVQTAEGKYVLTGDMPHLGCSLFPKLDKMELPDGTVVDITPAPDIYGPYIINGVIYDHYACYDSFNKIMMLGEERDPKWFLTGHAVTVQNRFAAYGCGKEQHLRSPQSQSTGGLGKPLIPADADADFAESGFPDSKAGVAGGKVKLFLIEVIVRNMRLPIDAQKASVSIQHRRRVEKTVAVPFVKTDG